MVFFIKIIEKLKERGKSEVETYISMYTNKLI